MSLPKYYVKANTYSNISPYPSWRRDFDYWQKDLTTNLYYLQGNVGIGYSVVHGGFVVSSNIGIGTNNPIGKLDVVGNVVVDSGSAFTPSFSFRDNNNTGIYQPTTNTLAFSTNGNQRMIIDASGNLILNNNLVVNGSTISMNTDTVTINDPIITLGNNTSTDIYDRGVDFKWYNGAEVKNGFIGLKQSSGNFVLYNDASNTNNVYSGTTGGLQIKSLVCDVSMGTAPLTVSSSTLVTNLNADLLDGLSGGQFMRSDISTSCLGNISGANIIASGNLDVSGNISGANITASDTISGTRLISTIASGTSPLTVTSSTLVTNLNADLLDGLNNTQFMRSDISTSCLGNLDVSGNIAIRDGTVSSPSLTFTTDTNTGLYRPGTDALGLVTGGLERVRVDLNGNVGIGTVISVNKLQVNGVTQLGGVPNLGTNGGFRVLRLSPVSGSSTQITFDRSTSTGFDQSYLYNDSTVMELSAPKFNFAIGNVGIGTSNPQAKLDVNGNVAISGSNIQLAGGGNILYRDVNATVLDSPSATAYMALKVNTIDRITIKADGNVGIGLTNPQAKLHVNGNLYAPGITIQTVTTTVSLGGTVNTSIVYTGISLSITPKFASSKILIHVSSPTYARGANYYYKILLRKMGNSTDLAYTSTGVEQTTRDSVIHSTSTILYTETPNTTSSITYELYHQALNNAGSPYFVGGNGTGLMVVQEICV